MLFCECGGGDGGAGGGNGWRVEGKEWEGMEGGEEGVGMGGGWRRVMVEKMNALCSRNISRLKSHKAFYVYKNI